MLVVIVALESELSRRRLPVGMQLLHSGVGKINAAMTACDAIARLKPRLIVNYGTAGERHSGVSGLLEMGSVIHRDMNAEPLAPRGVTPFAEMVDDLLNSKSMFVVPCGSWTRCQNMCRNLPSAFVSR